MTRILYVGTDREDRESLRSSLQAVRKDWEIKQVKGTFEAFHALQTGSFDAVIVDWESERPDAGKILQFAERTNSVAIRYVVSEFEDRRPPAELGFHVDQHFNPETDPSQVADSLEKAMILNAAIKNDETRLVVGQMTVIPTIPAVYSELMENLNDEETSSATVSKILAKDVAMTAKTLQLANSAYFGSQKQVSDLRVAVRLIGFRTISSMALAAGVFQQMKSDVDQKLIERLWAHSMNVARLARDITMAVAPEEADEAFTSGMLHEIGTLVIAANDPSMYKRLGNEVFFDDNLRATKEKEVFGATHAQIGAYLLGRWGIADRIIDAVAYHHEPSESHSREFDAIVAVHIADAITNANEHKLEVEFPEICDVEFIESIGCAEMIPRWETNLKFVPESVA